MGQYDTGVRRIDRGDRASPHRQHPLRFADERRSGAPTPWARHRDHTPVVTVAYAFYHRIEAFGQQHEADVAKILGHVVAHEMGHLLLPHDSHTLRGVMRGRLSRAQWGGTANGLAFTRDQAELMRNMVPAMLTN